MSEESHKFVKGIIAGSFDLIHPGYVRMFREAKEVCDHLIIALQGDPTIERPNKCKPVQSVQDRQEILMSIRYVDEIVHYNTEAELLEVLKTVPFDVRVIGEDYIGKRFTGDDIGKPIHYCKRDHDFSTTSLKESIRREMDGKVQTENLNKKEVWGVDSHYY